MKKIIIPIVVILIALAVNVATIVYFSGYNNPDAKNKISVNVKKEPIENKKPIDEKVETKNLTTATLQNASKWITADPHTHMQLCSRDYTPKEMVDNMKKNKINITSFLIWSKGLSDPKIRALVTGKDHPASEPNHILHADVEISYVAAAHMGHLILLGLQDLGFSDKPDIYPKSGVPIVEWAAKQNPPVVVGGAHGQWALRGENFKGQGPDVPLGFPIHVARGQMQFLELTEWYGKLDNKDVSVLTHVLSKLLNSGFRVTLTGGSDFDCLADNIGQVRTYALVKDKLSYDNFLDALKKGRTVIANNSDEWINIKVNGSGIGSETKIKAGESVTLEVESDFIEGKNIEILSNGKILTTVFGKQGKNKTQTKLTFNTSSWIMARTMHVLTSPTYVIVDNKPIRALATDACYLVRYVDYLTNRIKTDIIKLGSDKDVTLKAYAEARATFMKRFKEAGGTDCS